MKGNWENLLDGLEENGGPHLQIQIRASCKSKVDWQWWDYYGLIHDRLHDANDLIYSETEMEQFESQVLAREFKCQVSVTERSGEITTLVDHDGRKKEPFNWEY